jgi:hypothetical protein
LRDKSDFHASLRYQPTEFIHELPTYCYGWIIWSEPVFYLRTVALSLGLPLTLKVFMDVFDDRVQIPGRRVVS